MLRGIRTAYFYHAPALPAGLCVESNSFTLETNTPKFVVVYGFVLVISHYVDEVFASLPETMSER